LIAIEGESVLCYTQAMSCRTTLYLILILYVLVSWLIVRLIFKKKRGETLYEKIVFHIFQMGCVFSLAFFILLVTLKAIYSNLPLMNFDSMKIIIVGMLIVSLSLVALSYINYKTLKQLGAKK